MIYFSLYIEDCLHNTVVIIKRLWTHLNQHWYQYQDIVQFMSVYYLLHRWFFLSSTFRALCIFFTIVHYFSLVTLLQISYPLYTFCTPNLCVCVFFLSWLECSQLFHRTKSNAVFSPFLYSNWAKWNKPISWLPIQIT